MTRRINWRRAAVWALVLNELRGAAVVAMTWRLWWPILERAWHH